ncbi:MAG: hypothetical protein ACWA5W_07855, partial [Phycisphaerales bacterium]
IGQLDVMKVLDAQAKGPRQPEWLSTHPHPATRIADIQKLLDTEYAYTQGNPAFVMKKAEYESQMLVPLRNLPPPPKAKEQPQDKEQTLLLDHPEMWCAECRTMAMQ